MSSDHPTTPPHILNDPVDTPDVSPKDNVSPDENVAPKDTAPTTNDARKAPKRTSLRKKAAPKAPPEAVWYFAQEVWPKRHTGANH